MYIYGVVYIGKIYGGNYAQNNINHIEKNPGLLSLHLFSQIPIYTRGWETNEKRIYKLSWHLHVKVNLNFSLFPVLGFP